jgi:frataxin-like iron-binding protein CyaY
MSIPALYTNVIDGLLKKSLSKEVIWDVTTNADVFVVYFKDSSLVLHQHSNQDETWISVDVIDYKGNKIDGFWVSDDENEDWTTINELFSIARRSALAIDKAIEGMLTEINRTGSIGQRKKIGGNSGFTDDIPF